MNRQPILSLLSTYKPFDDEEQQMVNDTISFIQQHEDCFERSLLIGHVTGSAWIINPEGTHALLIHHYKLDKWVQPGGHCDGDSNVQGVAAKEAVEETGAEVTPVSNDLFDIDIHTIPQRRDVPEHLHYDIRFLFKADKVADVLPHNHESKEVRWISLDEVANYNNEKAMLRMIDKSKLLKNLRVS